MKKTFGIMAILFGIAIVIGSGFFTYFWDSWYPDAARAFEVYLTVVAVASSVVSFVLGMFLVIE